MHGIKGGLIYFSINLFKCVQHCKAVLNHFKMVIKIMF